MCGVLYMRIQAINSNFFVNKIQKQAQIKNQPESSEIDSFTKKTNLQSYYPNAISFEGLNAKGLVKQRGILMHITSLPSHRSFCGQFGDPQIKTFIQIMKAFKQNLWIMNPLNALDHTLCPYGALGRYSRNKFIVNLNELATDKYENLLKENELPDDITTPNFTFKMLEEQKNPRFKIAFERFKQLDNNTPIKQEYNKFIEKNGSLWVNEYACFDMLSKKYGQKWLKWDKNLQTAPEDAKKEGISLEEKIFSILGNREEKDNIDLYKFEQFLYDKQFHEFVEDLNKEGIHLVLDLPIGVSARGVDTWGKKNIFILDENFRPPIVSGCPPEKAFGYTQCWEHALYNYDSPEFWEYQEETLRQLVETADLRLDHFVAYINRAEIPTSYTKKDGTVLHGKGEIFKPKSAGGMGANFFLDEWIVNIDDKRSPKGENVFELFVRIAEECGKKPEDTYILESFGPLARTDAYKKFEEKYGKKFITQRVPIAMGIAETNKKLLNLNYAEIKEDTMPYAYLTGNHDMASLREYIDNLLGFNDSIKKVDKKSQKRFKKFCKEQLKLTKEEMKNPETVWLNAMKWHYSRNVKQVQTTLQDALGIYWRPNTPGNWNGMYDKFLQKPTATALLDYWCKVFPKDFLTRDNESGIEPGYLKAVNRFKQIMDELYPEE